MKVIQEEGIFHPVRHANYDIHLRSSDNGGETVTIIKTGTDRYFNEFLRIKSGPDLHLLGLYPNAKEITEQFGLWNALVHKAGWQRLLESSANVYVCGDGKRPILGALIAFRSKYWNVFSVDPIADLSWNEKGIRTLHVIKKNIEEIKVMHTQPVAIIYAHSHAPLYPALDNIGSSIQKTLVIMECCVPQDVKDRAPDEQYTDWGIWGPKNEIKVWRNV